MAEPKKETVRTALPQKPETTLRRPPLLRTQAALSPLLQALPKPAGASTTPFEPATSPLPSKAVAPLAFENLGQTGPKKETARIALEPRGSLGVAVLPPAAAVVATSNAVNAFDSIPRSFCWGLLGISALIFLIQIWNYTLS